MGWFRFVSGWELTNTTESRASAHVVALCFSHTELTQTNVPFNPTTLQELLQGHCAWRPSSLSLASWSLHMSSPTSVMVSVISMAEARAWQLNESMYQLYEPKMDTNYEMLQKSQTHDMMNGCLWVCRKLGSPCSRVPEAQPAAVPAPSRRRCRSGCSPGRLYLWCC